jgi:SAM-dependent methyltransferase
MTEPHCWCTNSNLTSFNEDYLRCQSCETLVCRTQPQSPAAFYGRDYWTTRQTDTLGHPDIYHRARLDLSERAVYWLKTVLKYKRPPGKTLELGSGHGGFSALLQWAGFQAMGLEPHAWVSQLSHTVFNIPTLTGRLADQSIEPQSLDVIILLDVLEHLPDPVETLHLCYALLKADGLLLIQTPGAPPNQSFAEMETAGNPFLKMLLPLEHLYLYTESSIQQLLNQCGFPHLTSEKALFPYDMFLVAAVSPLPTTDESDPADSLTERPASRLVLALLDLHDKWQKAETERTAQAQQILELNERLQTAETDRAARLEQINTLTGHLEQSETDRLARIEQIETLSEQLITAEADRTARLEQITELTTLLKTSETDRAARKEQIETLTRQLAETETDRTERYGQIKQLTTQLAAVEKDSQDRLAQIETLTGWLETAEADRAARLEQVNELTRLLAESETDRAARLEQIQTLTAALKKLESQPGDRQPPASS